MKVYDRIPAAYTMALADIVQELEADLNHYDLDDDVLDVLKRLDEFMGQFVTEDEEYEKK